MSDSGAPGGPPTRDGDGTSEPPARPGGGRRGRGGRGRGGRGRGGRDRRPGRGQSGEPEAKPRGAGTGRASNASPARDGRSARDGDGSRDAARSGGRGASRNGGRARREVSAGGVVFRVVTDANGLAEPHFLLIRDSYRNWGFPKGHLERGELPDAAAVREVTEETGLGAVELRGVIETIDWYFRFRGRLIHKICHFFLMETERSETSPQVAEGITACRWAPFEEAVRLVSYANAREVLKRAHVMVNGGAPVTASPSSDSSTSQRARE